MDKRFKFNDLKLLSEIEIINFKLTNKLELKRFFPNIQKEISFINHLIKVDYSNNSVLISGKGHLALQDKVDLINYNFLKEKDKVNFKTNLIIDKNPINIDFLNYKKRAK